MYITKETKLQLSCCCHDNSYATGPVLITIKICRFLLTQGSSTPSNLMGRVKTMWEPCLFRGRPPVPLRKVANRDIWFFTERDWSQGCCHGNNIVGVIFFFMMYISDAKFEDHCSNISEDILNSVFYRFSGTIYDIITFLICITENMNICKTKKYSKKKQQQQQFLFFFTLKSL